MTSRLMSKDAPSSRLCPDENSERRVEFTQKLSRYGVKVDCSKIPHNYIVPLMNGRLCLFCMQRKGCIDKSEKPIHHNESGMSVHYLCLLLACGLEQRSKEVDCDLIQTPQAIYGFHIEDILQEFKRGLKLKCNFCFKPGATIGCSVKRCRAKYHLNCGVTRNVLFQFFGTFNSFCRKHRPTQGSSTSLSLLKGTCCMCLQKVTGAVEWDVLISPCCNVAFHRVCVQEQALSSGLYLFKCPACNNKEEYLDEMHRMGTYIPQRDASWETPGAFADLLDRHKSCDVVMCKCVHGRKQDIPETDWAIVMCRVCGLSGSHVACSGLRSGNSAYVCEICSDVHDSLVGAGCDPRELSDPVASNTRQRAKSRRLALTGE